MLANLKMRKCTPDEPRLCWFAFLMLVLLLITSCTPLPGSSTLSSPPSPTPKIITIEDEGEVCIQPQIYRFGITLTSGRCFSGSIHCTEVLEQSGEVKIDRENSIIQVHSKFVIADSSGFSGCDADCSGVGGIKLGSFALSEGIYTVRLGEIKMGTITIPFDEDAYDRLICFTTKLPLPTATYSGPTATVWPTRSSQSPLSTPLPNP